jgi:LacI family transcriptional regulator
MKKRITIHDIAKRLNTSASTVSRALQNHPRISTEMKQAVSALASELNYQPNSLATNLRRGKGNTLGIILPQVDRHFFARAIRGMDEIASQNGFDVLIGQSYESVKKEAALVDSMVHGKVDGLMVSVSLETVDYSHFKRLLEQGVPIVFFDRIIEDIHASAVALDDYRGALLVTEHLISRGYKRIAHFSGPSNINVYRDRTRGYSDALRNAGMPIDRAIIMPSVLTNEKGYEAMEHLLKTKSPPDAVMSSGDYSALGAMLCAKKAGMEIPGDIGFTGFANEPFTSLIQPSMTTVEQHGVEMGRKTAEIIINEIQARTHSEAHHKTLIKPDLLIRESSNRILSGRKIRNY